MQEARERGMTPEELSHEWVYACGNEYIGYSRGFIFPDGSVLEIGYYEDHRIISPEDWLRLHLVTYSIMHGEANFRVNGLLKWPQAEMMKDMCEMKRVGQIFIDVYNDEDRYMGSIEIDNPRVSAEYIFRRVYDLL